MVEKVPGKKLAVMLETKAAEGAELRTRLELTKVTQSNIGQKRDRLQEELNKERGKQLQAELEAERSKGF